MKNYFILLFFVFNFAFVSAQSGHDSQTNKQHKQEITEQDYLKAMAFFDASEDQPSEDLEKALGTAQMYLMRKNDTEGIINLFGVAAQYAKRTDQIKEYIDLKSNQSQMLISVGKNKEAIAAMDSLIGSYEIENGLLGRFHKAIGDAYSDLENLKEAENNYFKGLSFAQQEKDTFNIGICYISLATMHSKLGSVYDAIDYNIKGLNILEKGDNAYLVAGACNVLCSIFQELGNFEKAQEYADKMDQLCEMNGYKQLGGYAKAALAKQAKQRGDYDETIALYELALKEFDRKDVQLHGANNRRTAFKVKTDIADSYQKKGDYRNADLILKKLEESNFETYPSQSILNYYNVQLISAIALNNRGKVNDYLNKANAIVDANASFESKKTLAHLNKLSAEFAGNYKEANIHLNTYFALKDSIEKEHKSQLIHNLEAKYQKAEQEKEISKLSFENDKAESELKQKNIWLVIGGIGLAFLSFLVFQLYKLYQNNKKNKEQLAAQNIVVTKALDDKNTLLKEIHHRVKNNLQVISSLLSLQSRYIKDEETLDALKASKSRVQSMSLLHQNLYRDDNLKGVEMNQYFQNLGQNLFDTYNIEENIQFTTDIDDITLDIDTVVPMGLITNELISNALKHAFKGKDYGKIHLSLKERDNTLILTVKDNGLGLPDGELPVSHKSLGATLIQSFAEKLEGEITIDTSEGSSVSIAIKDYTKIK